MTELTIPPDAFALEELRRRYDSADASGRIAILQEDALPFAIARLAVEDPNVEVRQWFARHGRDYTEFYADTAAQPMVRFPDRDLLEILRKDPDPFVRACVYLNPAFSFAHRSLHLLGALGQGPGHALAAMMISGERQKTWWLEASHLERLAMARTTSFSSELLTVFDLKDNELGLSIEERRELISAFLAGRLGQNARHDSESGKTWELVSEWPEESNVPPLVYRFFPTSDKTAAEIYQKCGTVALRRTILCMVWEEMEKVENEQKAAYMYRSTLELAIKDADPACRLLAYAGVCIGETRYWRVRNYKDRAARRKESRKLLRSARHDIYALSGLAKNLSLSPRELNLVSSHAAALSSSLNSVQNLRVNLDGDAGYTTSEKDLRVNIHRDVERTISRLRLERELGKLRVSDDSRAITESKAEWAQDERLDYLTSISLSADSWWVFAQGCGVASGVGLIVFSLMYVLGAGLALSLFLFFLCSWLGWLIPYRLVRKTQFTPPWVNKEKYNERLKHLWGEGPRKAPLIQDRPQEELETEAKMKAQRAAIDQRQASGRAL